MLDNIVNNLKVAAQNATNAAEQVGAKIKETYECLGRKVTELSNQHLSASTRNTLKETYHAAPYTAALTPFVLLGVGPLAASVALLACRVFEEDMDRTTSKRVYDGIRNACVLGAAVDTARSIAMLNPILFLFYIPLYTWIGVTANEHAQRVNARAF